MSQDRIIQLLSRELAGEISMAELHELNELRSRYPDTAYYEELLKQLWTPVSEEHVDVSYQYKKHQEKYFKTKSAKRVDIFKSIMSSRVMKLSCALLFIIGCALLISPEFSNTLFTNEIKVIAEKGIRKNIILPDGTNVWLNAESELCYDEDIATNPERVIKLTGEAFFDVRHSKKRPFIIKTNQISINVLGTAFNVKAYENERRTETSLVRGSIELFINEDPGRKIRLKPSEKFIYTEAVVAKNNGQRRSKVVPIVEHLEPILVANNKYIKETSWTNNLLLFQNESLEELAPKLERWYNVKIDIKNPKVKEYKFTGSFSNETIEEALSAMKLIKHYEFKIKGHDIEIY